MEELLDILNPQQQRAVAAPPGPTLILAGPGSGKTRVLTYRIAYLIGVLNIPPHNILAVTFTNKAAKEMGSRVDQIIGAQATGVWLGTFHAICGRILRREADLLPVDSNFVIFDEDDQKALIKSVLKEFNVDNTFFRPRTVLDAISRAKNDLLKPQDIQTQTFRDEQVVRFYTRYQQLLINNNAMDFDDMLMYTADLLENIAVVKKTYAHRFEHILVDEFQDTNKAQYQILRHMASQYKNLYVVGDEDQSIYRWRGADYRNIQRLKRDFPDLNTLLLEQNYRSTQTILDAAVSVIDQNPNRTKKKLFTNIKQAEKIKVHEASDDHEEASYVVETIQNAINKREANLSDFSIMYRTNAQSRLLEEAFRRSGINYKLVGAQRFYGRREVRDLIAFLRLIYNPRDEISLERVINLPPRGIGDKTFEKLKQVSKDLSLGSGEVLLDLAKGDQSNFSDLFGREGIRLTGFANMFAIWRSYAQETSLSGLFDLVVQSTDYQSYINDRSDEGIDRWENVMELRAVILEYEELGLAAFLEAMALIADQDTLTDVVEAPTMLTLHAAKGLEFERVFIIGLDEMLLPHSRSMDDVESLAEERRLFYVGMTRAKKQLFLVRALRRRSTYGSYEETQASRFLEDIPDQLLQKPASTYRSFSNHYKNTSVPRWEVPAYRTTERASAQKKYATGMQVMHPVYGRGVVRMSRMELGDETVEVFFEGVGLKALVASLANLEII